MLFKTIMGILYLLYGVSKLVIGTLMMVLPEKSIAKIPVLKKMVEDGKDMTISGRMVEWLLMLFGVYTILYGAAVLGWLPHSFLLFLEQKRVEYTVFIVIGLVLVIFYALVLYSNLPIPKDERHRKTYLWFGIGGGISFLIMPVIWEALAYASPALNRMPYETRSLVILGGSIFALFLAWLTYLLIKQKGVKPKYTLGKGVQLEPDTTAEKSILDPN
jgi:hypothetical protein